jgi:cystathionine beta-lyase
MSNIETDVIHGGIPEDKTTGAVNIPIYLATTFRQKELGVLTGGKNGFEYGRSGNPTRQALEELIAELEEGTRGFAFSSGLGALTTTFLLFKSGDKVLISSNVYGGTYRMLDKIFKQFGLNYDFVDTNDLPKVESAIKKDKSVKAILVESPANPLLTITDLKAIGDLAKKYKLTYIVDNTFMTPYLQKPLTLGADIVLHSATKYLGGHSDVIGGLIAAKDKEIVERLGFLQNAAGAILSPFDSYFLIKGIKTLHVRLDRHNENAEYTADFLTKHEGVRDVYFPGLKTSQGYAVHKKQAKGPGGMISFTLNEKKYNYKTFLKELKIIALAESLGGVESLICHPATMTHASIPADIRKEIGITDSLLRLSVGIENKKDIVNDIGEALIKAKE